MYKYFSKYTISHSYFDTFKFKTAWNVAQRLLYLVELA